MKLKLATVIALSFLALSNAKAAVCPDPNVDFAAWLIAMSTGCADANIVTDSIIVKHNDHS